MAGLCGNASGSADCSLRTKRNAIITEPDSIPVSVRQNYYVANSGQTIQSPKWRVGLIEQRYVIEITPGTAEFHSDEIIVRTGEWTSLRGLTEVTLTSTKGFSEEHSVTTTKQIKVGAELTLASIFGAGAASASASAQASYTKTTTTYYCSKYTENLSFSAKYKRSEMPEVEDKYQIAPCLVGDFIRAKATVKTIGYWWWGIETVVSPVAFDFELVTYSYNTYCFSNGVYGASEGRPDSY